MRFTSFFGAFMASSMVLAHPGHNHEAEQAERRSFMQHSRRDLSHCQAKMRARALESRAGERRRQTVERLRKNVKRDAATVLATSHKSDKDYTNTTPLSTVFSESNSCVLSPEVTEGPYYVAGEYIRQDIRDKQPGVDMYMDFQVLDVNTCDPVPNVYLEIWHCNSTGVYSGVSNSGNGNSDTDLSNLDLTYLRGVQKTDADGAVQFQSLFPGHYTGRTTHVHVMVHVLGEAAASNSTLMSTQALHVGQAFFDQDIIHSVEATSVYKTNTQTLTLNAEDDILAEEAATSDPFMQYVLLGDSVEDGLFSWLSFGIDTTINKTINAASYLYKEGGATNPNGQMGGPGGPPPSRGNTTATAGATATGSGSVTTTTAVTAGANRLRRLL